MRTSPHGRLFGALLVVLLLLAACGSSEIETSETAEAVASVETTEAVEPETQPTTANEPDEAMVDDEAAADGDHADEGHDHEETAASASGAVNLDLFFDGAIVESSTVECTLSGGTETMCYSIVVAGDPVSYDTGPFCPTSITDDASAGGLWFDGEGLYDVDGDFIVGLAELYDDDNWMLYNEDGSVNVTETAEEFDAAARPDVDESLQNHCVAGRVEFLTNGEPITSTVLIPVEPVLGDSPTASRGNLGVTLDGVVIAASAPVDAILSAYTIAAFDDCGGHYNPFEGYHLHGAVGCSEVGDVSEGETPIFAYAMDGVPVHSALDTNDLDACNGHSTDELGYHYHANPAEENLVIECLMGETATTGDAAAGERPERPERGERPEGGAPPEDG